MNRAAHRAYVRAWRLRHPEKTRLYNHRGGLKRRYGITIEQYQELLRQQKGGCGICGRACTSGMRLSVDHDHKTQIVRGLLCRRCNTWLGWFEKLGQAASAYLKRAR